MDLVPRSLSDPEVERVFAAAATRSGVTASPTDWRDMWIYFLMVDRFNRSEGPPRHQPWDDPHFDGYQGGTFEGVQAQLPYIKALGAGAIWLSPVLKNLPFDQYSYHGYGIHDFLHAEPRFARDPGGADEELRALVDAAHSLGLYVIFDIVLNHIGDAFCYVCAPGDGLCEESAGAQATHSDWPRNVRWRSSSGLGDGAASDIAEVANPSRDALVWPAELQSNSFFRRQGVPAAGGPDTIGDFVSLKQMRTEDPELQHLLISAYCYVVARWDVDGFRIDTLRYLQGGLPRRFGNAMREFGERIGKKNFFTFGEVFDAQAEDDIARFIGRQTADKGDIVGVDAALDYPLYFTLPSVAKGFSAPSRLNDMFLKRHEVEDGVISSHGDATRFFVTFLDNHDVKQRLRYIGAEGEHPFDDQVTLALTCLLTLPGIPCIYYGTEQGLHGSGSDAAVREAMWGGPGFDERGPFFRAIAAMSRSRQELAALRYGRFYMRPVSGDGFHFGLSDLAQGVIAYSRVLSDQEVVVVANTNAAAGQRLHVIIDAALNNPSTAFDVSYSNQPDPTPPAGVHAIAQADVLEADGGHGTGPLLACAVSLRPLEVQVLAPRGTSSRARV